MSMTLQRPTNRASSPDLTAVGWVGQEDLSYDDWLRQGSRLGLAGRNSAWWIGDWLRYGSTRYGQKYAAAARVTGYDRQTLMNMVYVATRFEFSRRREALSWSHHAEVAALDTAAQEAWLDRAVVERLSVRDLREELSAHRGVPGRQLQAPARSRTVKRREVTCPHCGERFVPDAG